MVRAADEQVTRDAERFFKFNFLTGGGDPFNHTKSFIVRDGDWLRLLYTDVQDQFHSARFTCAAFTLAVRSFFGWLATEGNNAG